MWQPCSLRQKELQSPRRSQAEGSASRRSSSLLNQEAHKKALSLGNPCLLQFPPAWRLGKNNKGVSGTMSICEVQSALQKPWEAQLSILPSPGSGGQPASLGAQAGSTPFVTQPHPFKNILLIFSLMSALFFCFFLRILPWSQL